jgi:hypothetical protein
MRRRNRPGCLGLKARAALLLAAAIILLAVRQRSTTLPPRALVKSESKASEALRAVRAADADHAAQAKGDDERREELNQALRARAQAADAAASAAQAREQARNATQFLKCTHRTKAYGAAWLARTELLKRQRMSQDKDALEYASFHILTESIRLGATALKAADDSFWVNHISGYEHNVNKREGADAAENKVNAMVRVLTNKLCIPRTTTPPTHVAPAVRVVVPWISELDFDFVLYDEADQTLHFEGTALRDVFDVLTQHPDYYVAPQRYEKRWGGIPQFVLQGNLSRTMMNTCDPKLPRLVYNQ